MTGRRSVVAAVAAFVVLAMAAGCSGGEPEAGPTTPAATRVATRSPSSPAPPAITCGNLLDNFPEEVYESPSITRASEEDSSVTSWRVCSLSGKAPDGRSRGHVTVSIERALTPPDGGLRRWGRDKVDHEIDATVAARPASRCRGMTTAPSAPAGRPTPR